jgi:hypothetical protein
MMLIDQTCTAVKACKPWRDLLRAVERRAVVDREVIDAVAAMRAANWPWSDIGHLLGTSGQAAQQRYGSRTKR